MLLARFRLILEAECLVSELFRCVEDEVFTAYRAIFVEPFALERYVSERIMRRRMDSSVCGQLLVVNGWRIGATFLFLAENASVVAFRSAV